MPLRFLGDGESVRVDVQDTGERHVDVIGLGTISLTPAGTGACRSRAIPPRCTLMSGVRKRSSARRSQGSLVLLET